MDFKTSMIIMTLLNYAIIYLIPFTYYGIHQKNIRKGVWAGTIYSVIFTIGIVGVYLIKF